MLCVRIQMRTHRLLHTLCSTFPKLPGSFPKGKSCSGNIRFNIRSIRLLNTLCSNARNPKSSSLSFTHTGKFLVAGIFFWHTLLKTFFSMVGCSGVPNFLKINTPQRSHFDSLLQRGEIFKIKKINAFVKPVLYKLEDLLGAEVKGQFYEKQLRLAPNADDPDFIFEIETVEKKKKVKGVEHLFVKYLYYPGENQF